jgi:hypothetical protein
MQDIRETAQFSENFYIITHLAENNFGGTRKCHFFDEIQFLNGNTPKKKGREARPALSGILLMESF